MKDDSNNLNLCTLKEMVLDEHKLVTYVSLSKDLCIHVNESKFLLDKVVNVIRNENPNVSLNLNYITSGLLENNKVEIAVCKETDLIQFQEKFKKVFFQHIYSVGLGSQSSHLKTDKVSLLAVNKFGDIPLCSGLIKSVYCTKRPAEEILHLKTQSQELISCEVKADNIIVKKSKDIFFKNGTTNGDSNIKTLVAKSKPDIKTEIISPKKDSQNAKHTGHKIENKSQKGINSFFSKASGPKENNKVKKENEERNLKKETDDLKNSVVVKTEKMDVDNVTNISDRHTENRHNIKQNRSETKKNLNKSLEQIKNTAKVDKKRKRVLHVSDSDSGEENDPFIDEPLTTGESDDVIPPTPLANTVKITSGIINPKKKRKVVDKTYTDEDGYILTKKVEVYESCSETEEELGAKENVQTVLNKAQVSPKEKNALKNTKKKISSPQKGKQATIMSFFKKK